MTHIHTRHRSFGGREYIYIYIYEISIYPLPSLLLLYRRRHCLANICFQDTFGRVDMARECLPLGIHYLRSLNTCCCCVISIASQNNNNIQRNVMFLLFYFHLFIYLYIFSFSRKGYTRRISGDHRGPG